VTDPGVTGMSTVRERLNAALIVYLTTLAVDDLDEINVEAVAHVAGVSRATAYRHFGDREGLLFHAALALTRRHADRALELISVMPTISARIEEGFAYTAREIRSDKLLRMLLTSRRSPAIDSVIRSLSVEISSEALRTGQLDGQVRSDLTVDELIDWTNEQQHVAIQLRLDEDEVRQWVRRFIVPVLRPQYTDLPLMSEMNVVFGDIGERVDALRTLVQGIQTSIS
jgi:AcrR family transcriptional regulator